METSLRSGDDAVVAEAVAVPEGSTLDPAFADQLRALSITIDASTFHDGGDGTATVTATAGGGPGGRRWVLGLISDGISWKITASAPESR